jgi:hypothetical protein
VPIRAREPPRDRTQTGARRAGAVRSAVTFLLGYAIVSSPAHRRLLRGLQTCRPVKERLGELTLTGFAFDGMPFYAGWSGSKARLQSKPIRWL